MNDLENAKILRAEVGVLKEQRQCILNEKLNQAKDSDVGKLYLILSRLGDLETGFDKGQACALLSNGVTWALTKTI